jgi:nucleoside-diphosphate-sugar epimerase
MVVTRPAPTNRGRLLTPRERAVLPDNAIVRILVLGGTLFVGRAVVESAVQRGWTVVTFNRGRSAGDVPGAEPLHGDRNGEQDVQQLTRVGHWDAVIDCSGYVPENVHQLSRLLEPHCDRYVFVSTVSVYEDWPMRPLSEASRTLECPIDAGPNYGPPDIEDGPTRYGRLKAGCELAAAAAFGEARTTIVRPGVVLGPGEYVGRLPWWLQRINEGGKVIVPGEPTRGIQPIDVRDVAEFILDTVARRLHGAFNLVAPTDRDTFADLVQACKEVTSSDAEFIWVPDDRLLAFGVRQWSELPLWRTYEGVWQVDSRKAVQHGLICRPIALTVADTWRWMAERLEGSTNERSAEIGLSATREEAILSSLEL